MGVRTPEDAPGSSAETDGREGSTARFLDPSRSEVLDRVVVSRRPEVIEVVDVGRVVEGEDDTASATARAHPPAW